MKIKFRYGKTLGCFNLLPAIFSHYPASKYESNKMVSIEFSWFIWAFGWAFKPKRWEDD